ncbi:MAG: hypothetical protein JWN17_1417, partial [Frankiales bacterium]|nr:hypothetical protein [Frankiales bacterium]
HLDVQAELARLHEVPVNYELDGDPSTDDGWTFDDYCRALPSEPPGDPVAGGPWEKACALVRDYEFADPSIIRAVFLPDSELAGRDMLLQGRFLFLRFLLGVRVSAVVDETVQEDGHTLRVWGWCYRTLSGHLEAGEMCYRVVKVLETGEVQFRVCRYVRSEAIPNPVVRFGWATFGRFMQVLFVRRSLARMRRLVEGELAAGRHTVGVPLASTRIEVKAQGDA